MQKKFHKNIVVYTQKHIKALANKKKHQKELVAKTAKRYEEQLRAKVNADREKLGKPPIEDDDEPPKAEKTVSTTDPDCGLFVKGEHERQFAYKAHTVCERHGFVLDVEVTAGNVHDSVAWDAMRKQTIERVFGDAKEKHAMRYTQHRGLTRVTQWVRLKYAAMNLKKLATWAWNSPRFSRICLVWMPYMQRTAVFTT